jgi:hypothetical protein
MPSDLLGVGMQSMTRWEHNSCCDSDVESEHLKVLLVCNTRAHVMIMLAPNVFQDREK